MSDTPRTDAYYEKWQESWSREPINLDLCRQLERELAEAREGWKLSNEQTERAWSELAEARKQRDTLAEALENLLVTEGRGLDEWEREAFRQAKEALAAVKGGEG
jgi:hypothetical protein